MENAESLNPVLYACVAREKLIISQFFDSDPGLAAAAAESLASLPKLHKRFTFASNNRMACYSITPALTFCGIFEESFGRHQGFAFLRRVEDEFRRMILLRGFAGDPGDIPLVNMPADRDFLPTLRSLVNAANGQQTDDESFDDSVPLMFAARPRGEPRLGEVSPSFGSLTRVKSNSGKKPQPSSEMWDVIRAIDEEAQDRASASEPSNSSSCNKKLARNSSSSSSQRTWWCSIKIILLADLVVCIIVAIVWLVYCRGFECI